MRKKSILLLFGVMLFSISLAACGKKTEATFSYDAADGTIVAEKTEDTEDVVKTTKERIRAHSVSWHCMLRVWIRRIRR